MKFTQASAPNDFSVFNIVSWSQRHLFAIVFCFSPPSLSMQAHNDSALKQVTLPPKSIILSSKSTILCTLVDVILSKLQITTFLTYIITINASHHHHVFMCCGASTLTICYSACRVYQILNIAYTILFILQFNRQLEN